MNALANPTTLPGAAAMPSPLVGGSASRERADEPFSRCLDRAVDRDTAAQPERAGRPAAEPARARGRDDATAARDDHAAAPDGVRPGSARPDSAPAEGDRSDDHTQAATDGSAETADEAEPRGLDTLLPGWPTVPGEASPAAAAPALPAAVASGAAATGAAALSSGAAPGADAAARTDVTLTPAAASGTDGDARSAARRATAAAAAAPALTSGTATLQDGTASTTAFTQALLGATESATDSAAVGRLAAGARATAEAPTLPTWAAAAPAPSSAPAAAEPTRTAQAHVAAPMDSPAFAPALATQVRWLVREGMQEARLSLNPAEMGPVSVQIVIDGRDARIDFRADMAATRQALEASLPVLAAALDDSGLRLAGGGVHDGAGTRQGDTGAGTGSPLRGRLSAEAPTTATLPAAAAGGGGRERGLVDLVA